MNITVESVPSPPGHKVPGWLWLVVLLVLAGAALVIWDAWRRRARPAPAEGPSEEPTEEPTEEEVPPRELEEVVVGGPWPPGDGAVDPPDSGSGEA